jgi:hypothetical protein
MASLTASGVTNSSGRLILNGAASNPATVLNVQFINYTAVWEQLPGSVTTYDGPGVLGDGSLSITPISTSSRLLFSWTAAIGHEDTWRQNYITTFYKIGSGAWTQFYGGGGACNYISSNNAGARTCGNQFLLSLSTTSTVYFKIQIFGHGGESGYIHLNKNKNTNSTSNDNDNGMSTTMMVMELA